MNRVRRISRIAPGLIAILAAAIPATEADDGTTDRPADIVMREQTRRIEMIQRVAPAVVCIYDASRRGGGSGVIIDETGLGLTNYHVAAAMLDTRRGWGGLNDGQLYELEVLGIDPTGDVAMFRLHGRDKFSHAELGDSDAVGLGDEVVAMGNPFILSEDYAPTVTRGLVTGVHRYQWGVGNNLIYSDCIQVDAAINPGNSGGPLFDTDGRVVGINGRISVNTRGRFNVGFGYAISANQIKRFVPALRAGLLAMHGTLAVKVGQRDGLRFTEVSRDGAAGRAGIREGDTLLRIDGLDIASPNHFVSVLGTYPADRHVLVEIQREGAISEHIVRLDPITPDLQAPFSVDQSVNRRQLLRVLKGHRRAVLDASDARSAPAYRLHIAREALTTGRTDGEAPQHFRLTIPADGPPRMTRQYEDGTAGKSIEYDETRTVQRARSGAEPFDLTPWDRMVYAAFYLAQRGLLEPIESLELSRAAHAGGGSLLRRREPTSKIEATQVEVIEWPLGDYAVARLSFGATTSWLLRIDLTATVSGEQATLDVWDYQDAGGMRVPSRVDVRGDDRGFRDDYSLWERLP